MNRKKPLGIIVIFYLHLMLVTVMLIGLSFISKIFFPPAEMNAEFEAWKFYGRFWLSVYCGSIVLVAFAGTKLFQLSNSGRRISMVIFPFFASYAAMMMFTELFRLPVIIPIHFLLFPCAVYVLYIFYLTRPQVKGHFK